MIKRKSFLYRDRTVISSNIKEAFLSVFPVSIIVLILCATLTPIESGTFLAFIFGAFLIVVGMGLFSLGAKRAMTPIGNYVGTEVVKTKKLWLIIPVYFAVGVLITIAEPDLSVLSGLLEINKWTLLITVGVGVGVFLVIAFLRIVLKIKLRYLLIVSYAVIFILAIILKTQNLNSFIPLSFDSGGVTTGPISVPFIIAIGTGVASLRSDNGAEEDGFGLTALCSVGPIIAVMVLGLIMRPEINGTSADIKNIENSQDLFLELFKCFPQYLKEVGIALLPIVAVYFTVYAFGTKTGKNSIIKIFIGLFYTYFGLVLFLVGVNAGFLPVGRLVGEMIGAKPYRAVIVPIGMVLGFFVVAAEPAVHVLTEQVFEITSGVLPKKALSVSLMIGVALSVGLSTLRVILGIDLMWFLAPLYLIAIVLSFFVPDIFTAVAFDSGGVSSGAMTSSFLLPLVLGLTEAVGGNIATDGFGVVAMVAVTPLIAIQILGLIYRIKRDKLMGNVKVKRSKKKENILE